MNKWMCLLACLLVPPAHAQTSPKAVFTGDDFTSLGSRVLSSLPTRTGSVLEFR